MTGPAPAGILETCVYADDLAAAERFYGGVLGLELESRVDGRHAFFRCGPAMFLVFDARRTSTEGGRVAGAIIPLHGARGAGHVAFRMEETEVDAWRQRLEEAGVSIESDVRWPGGGRSLYVRDPAGNSVELATPRIWGL